MLRSWYDKDEEKPEFWLEFQVIHDGLETEPSPPSSSSSSTTISSSSESQGQTFHLFPLLPPELRLKIWECLIQPRIVAAACFDSRFEAQRRVQLTCRPRRPAVPVLLHVCRESRELALKHYQLAFAWRLPPRLAGLPPVSSSAASASSSSPSQSLASTSSEDTEEQTSLSSSSSSSLSSSSSSSSSAKRQPPSSSPRSLPDLIPPPNRRRSSTYARPITHPPKVYFNFSLDCLLLLGELEPYDQYGFNAPMSYFLRRDDTRRVQNVACAFQELHMDLYEADQVFGTLFHIIDMFPCTWGREGRLLITTNTPGAPAQQEESGKEDGVVYRSPYADDPYFSHIHSHKSAKASPESAADRGPTTDNVVQKLWSAFMAGVSGGSEKNSMVNTQIVMVREEELPRFLRGQSAAVRPKPGKVMEVMEEEGEKGSSL
ncbi:uncharacterized protein CTHT_0005450 [Thermochaetoides thermophila DSM 1495]|uniref:2EXR domain-containing protein n=1 Tax=Chaetomium thermophilum (strain DSM 1495 / CBS 144.50 / IMI 039719) TaxID=759272 RepID=G0RY52_CHATD|nr:hypothetical protein CTHT_0005450 [Thermochaetoides thermophila DSM 1495]EGS23838.1 hypothetical protein CTHT_0005450 [Thermochaetoides thermophila DSM 1495]